MSRATVTFLFLTSLLSIASSLSAQDCSGSELNFPRLSFETGTVTGIAVVNPNGVIAPITLTAYDEQGGLLAVTGPGNPAMADIGANAQYARTTGEIFGSADPGAVAWFQVCSPVADLTGFFLFLDVPPTTFLDGADLPKSSEKIVFTDVRVGSGLATEINIVNPGDSVADLQLELHTDQPSAVVVEMAALPSKGILKFDVADFFQRPDLPGSASIVVSSDTPVAGFELIGPAESANGPSSGGSTFAPATASALPDAIGLTARPALDLFDTLFFPQLAVGDQIDTEITVGNYTSEAEILTLSAYRPDGRLWGAPDVTQNRVTRSLGPRATLRVNAGDLFGFSSEGTFEGWIKVEGSRCSEETAGEEEDSCGSINGSVSYSLGNSFAAVSSVPEPRTAAIFSHLATTQGFFTGVAGLNAGAYPANVKIIAMEQGGTSLGEYRMTLLPGERFSKIVSTIIPGSVDQARGLVWVKSDQALYLTSLFGTSEGGLPAVLANVPPQAVPDAYRPDGGTEFLDVQPGQLVLEPSTSATFMAPGPVAWRINGLDNPLASLGLGQISPAGLYMAPEAPPAPQTVTIGAETPDNIGAASLDVVVGEEFFPRSGVLQSLVHLETLDALFSAELFAAGASVAHGPAGGLTTRVFQVGVVTPLLEFDGEVISRMLAFLASDGLQYLILANQTTGEILGLDPRAPFPVTPVVLESGFVQPTTMAFDAQGNALLVADLNGLHSVPQGTLDLVAGASVSSAPLDLYRTSSRRPALNRVPGAPGVAVDRCTGDLYVSDPGDNSILQLDRSTGEVTRRFADIRMPGQLLGFYRRDVGCPRAFNLLVAERGRNRVLILNPERNLRSRFVGTSDGRDLAFLPRPSSFSGAGTVLIAQGSTPAGTAPSGGDSGTVIRADVIDLYRRRPPNPPRICPGSFLLRDTTLHSAVADVLGLEPTDRIPCGSAQSLTTLEVVDAGVRDLTNIGFFSALKTLELPGNRISDLTPLNDLPGLVRLNLSDNEVVNLQPLRQLARLEVLRIDMNLISDLSPLAALNRLQTLIAHTNLVEDLGPLRGLAALRSLGLGANQISDLSPLKGLTSLTFLGASVNRIMVLKPLVENPGINAGDLINVEANPLSAESCPDITALRERGVTVLIDEETAELCGF